MNIAKILKNCQQYTKLYTPIWGDCVLEYVDDANAKYPIHVSAVIDGEKVKQTFTKNGKVENGGEILLFPSKDNRDWSAFMTKTEFKPGDFIYIKTNFCEWISIYSHYDNNDKQIYTFADIDESANTYFVDLFPTALCYTSDIKEERLATEEEKKKLLKELDERGYVWNSENGTIRKRCALKPFDRVLVRDNDEDTWDCDFFKYYEAGMYYCIGSWYKQCIPYDGNENLFMTDNKPDVK